jgi:endonuclease III
MRLMKPAAIGQFFATLAAHNPEPQTELVYRSHFELLVAVLLSAQATDVSVNKATGPLFARAPTPQQMLDLGLDRLTQAIQSIGLYKTKAKHVLATCEQLIALHGGEVPSERAALEALPGVGRKTANVVLNVAFGQPTMAVETHLFRVANRCGLAPGKTPLAVEQQLLKRIPKPYLLHAHHWLILHGRYVCKARKPLCGQCAVAEPCGAKALQREMVGATP